MTTCVHVTGAGDALVRVRRVHTFLLALHLLFAIFAVGPLIGAVSAAPRAVRGRAEVAAVARSVRIYTFASALVVLAGFGVMSTGSHRPSFGDTWIWLSLVLWVVAVGVALLVLVPALAVPHRPRVAASAGAITLLYAAIVVLMVYRR